MKISILKCEEVKAKMGYKSYGRPQAMARAIAMEKQWLNGSEKVVIEPSDKDRQNILKYKDRTNNGKVVLYKKRVKEAHNKIR